MEAEILALTDKWRRDIGGKDARVCIGACLGVLTAIGNYSSAEVRSGVAMCLRSIADEMVADRDPLSPILAAAR